MEPIIIVSDESQEWADLMTALSTRGGFSVDYDEYSLYTINTLETISNKTSETFKTYQVPKHLLEILEDDVETLKDEIRIMLIAFSEEIQIIKEEQKVDKPKKSVKKSKYK